jgi:hypothetical protein
LFFFLIFFWIYSMTKRINYFPDSENRGGVREGAGRPLGSIDRFSRKLMMEAFEDGKEHPLTFFLRYMRDEAQPDKIRLFAARECMPYVLPKLSHSTVEVESDLENLSMSEKIALAASLRDRILEQKPNAKIPKLPINGVSKRV